MTTPIVEVGGYTVHCDDCGHLLTRSKVSQESADEQAMEAGFGIPGNWLCDACAEKKRNPRGDYCLTENWAYDNSSQYDGVSLTIQTARKSHTCSHRPYCTIRPGQEYIRQTVAPWTMVADDVDDEGRTIGARNDEWSVAKYHRYADEHNTDGRKN